MLNVITTLIETLLHISLMVGQVAATVPCGLIFYQPEIPNELKR